jgi:replicative DNA helicase
MIDVLQTDTAVALPDLRQTRGQKPLNADPAKVDRLPPHSVEAEQGVLGCVLLSPKEGLGRCLEKFKRGAETFYDVRHQTLFSLLIEMGERQELVDLITVGQRLKDKNQLEGVGGWAYLSSLMDAVPSAANIDYYVDIVWEKYLLRKMIGTCTQAIARAYEEQDDVEGLLDEVERDVLKVSEERVESGARPVKELVHKAVETIEDYFNRKGALTGLGTGFVDLDRLTSGLHGGEMIVVAARPSMGKTALAMNVAEHAAVELNQPVAVFSLEMTAESLVLRVLCSMARVNLRLLREGFMVEADFAKLRTATGKLSGAPLIIDDSPALSILQLRARARRLWQQFGIKLFIVDYLQLLHSTARRAELNRQQEIAEISRGIKALAKELNVPVLVCSQLNREPERREAGAKPRLSDLRESGAIEQDADVVGLLYKPGGGDDEDGAPKAESDVVPTNLVIAKQRNGPTGDVELTFFRGFTRFESASKIGPEDVPP